MKKMPYLFPVEEIQYVNLTDDRIIFHRQKSSVGNRSLLGPIDEFCVKGFIVYSNIPSSRKNTQVGTFLFKGSEQRGGVIEITDEVSLRYVMAGIVLGERSANYQRKGVLINVTPGRIADLNIAIEIWQKWNWEWSGPEFREKCKNKNVLPLHEATEGLKSAGVNITAEALSKHLQRLKLPL